MNQLLVEADEIDHDFIDRHTSGFDDFAAHIRATDWDDVLTATGLTRWEIEQVRDRVVASERIVVCWAMGLTQHKHAVPTIREIVNFLLLRGSLGEGAGVCPVRGHSNVQGDRTMGIWEQMPQPFLDALGQEFGFTAPSAHGFDSVDAIRAMRDGRAKIFVGVAGNFVRATPDSAVTEKAMRNCRLTAHVSTKLNRSHAITGEIALILPTLGRSDRDVQVTGEQFVTVEDSMSMVHQSRGKLAPASPDLLSEPAIIARLATATLGPSTIPWADFERDYSLIRDRIARVVPGFDNFNERVLAPGGFRLVNGINEWTYETKSGKASFSMNEFAMLEAPSGHLILQTMRSHDQWNTIPYTDNDRYRGVHNDRRVVMVNPADLLALDLEDGARVDLVGVWTDGVERRAEAFTVVAYPTAPGCAAAYYPETNVLVPLDSVADTSNTPTSKGIVVRLETV